MGGCSFVDQWKSAAADQKSGQSDRKGNFVKTNIECRRKEMKSEPQNRRISNRSLRRAQAEWNVEGWFRFAQSF
jgi:hypothetical protein